MNALGSSLLPAQAERLERRIGVGEEALCPVLEDWLQSRLSPLRLILAANESLADRWATDIELIATQVRGENSGFAVVRLPVSYADAEDHAARFEAESERLSTLFQVARCRNEAPLVVVATPKALAQETPRQTDLEDTQISLRTGEAFGLERLAEELRHLDYDSESLCEAPGQYASRGGLIDVYPITEDKPYRIDFFGDEIESIRELDPVTQRSGEAVQTLTISASPRLELASSAGGFLQYLPDQVDWALVEPEDLLHAFDKGKDAEIGKFWVQLLSERETQQDTWTTVSDLDLESDEAGAETITYEAESLSFYRSFPTEEKLADERLADEQGARIRFLEQLVEWEKAGEKIFFVLPSASEVTRTQEVVQQTESAKELQPTYWTGDINQGFRIRFRERLGALSWPGLEEACGIVLVTATELFGRRRSRRPRGSKKAIVSQSQVDQLLDFAELVDGEFVVHLQHGIAVYRGITKVDIRGDLREVLTLEFDEGVTLHVPLQESHLISRYVGLTKTRPKLGRIGSNRWSKTREAAERATLDLAAQLLQIQAKRDLEQGHAFRGDTPWQVEFEQSFPYQETPDQLGAIVATKKDMEETKPMDRLICGDVGFGKTEVAIRAAFKAVMDGKQVGLLVPTTVLAQQHFLNFRDRMAGYPIVVELVSRFRSPSEIKKILQATKGGKVDILIGTHRLVQKDVSFADLGLVVIDEEQRFGVKHKEVFKQWRETVDMLSLSATPIPRTLYLALTGARELSVIDTAPLERKPIQTIVKSYDEKLVVEVTRREIERGGQVFYLHNRVQSIDAVALRLRELMPEISFGIGHGQMHEKELERVMVEFVGGRYQVLVCTTIIESGIDIPNCNTIIIEGADRFGLGQLYQIRGRVGRFHRQAYAYLLLHKHKRIMDIARKRLAAIRHHNQLGAGFRIAMRDLELRGAGNLLGSEQSGHIVGVGFELYCQLLKQSVARLKGEESALRIRANVKLDFVYQGEGKLESGNRYEDGFTVLNRIDLKENDCEPMQAAIPTSYLRETRLRIDLYRRLAMADSVERVQELRADMTDRFGPFPDEVEALLRLCQIRCLAEGKGILSVESQGNRLKCRVKSGSSDELVKLGSRFPRLSSNNALKRLNEVIVFLRNYSNR